MWQSLSGLSGYSIGLDSAHGTVLRGFRDIHDAGVLLGRERNVERACKEEIQLHQADDAVPHQICARAVAQQPQVLVRV